MRTLLPQPERMRRIGVLMFFEEDDPQSMLRVGAFLEGLHGKLAIRWELGHGGIRPAKC
jgi:hypothetical protein